MGKPSFGDRDAVKWGGIFLPLGPQPYFQHHPLGDENGVSLARILGLNHVNRRPCSPSRHVEREKASLPVDISVTQKRLWLSSLLGDWCVLSYDPRYICRTYFGFSFLFVSKTTNYKQNYMNCCYSENLSYLF